MDNTGTIAEPQAQESTETQSTESSGQGTVEPQGSQGQQDSNAGDPQGNSESGKGQGTEPRREFRKPSKNQTIYELRQAVRERDQKLQSFEERLASFEQKFNPRQERKPSRSFWEAPDEFIDDRLTNHLSEFEKRMISQIQEARQQEQQTAEWKQETMEATKLINDTLKLSPDEEEDLAELLRSRPAIKQMTPLERADYAIYLWNKEKGIANKSAIKNQAATVTGAGVSQGGPKLWSESEIEKEMQKFMAIKQPWDKATNEKFDAIDREIKRAYAENRVRK